ncbi:FtsW/RodA/SpoVE family cell cycle protein [uncultured Phascolarctobacterium sp.]|uniref:FtsW/RodA/SpoVE family cell cycle protein n=1 Tax=uncultured Phascolarctobacterium sp. TaxID=512296 RepID=UPI0027D96B57|nr:FtsW/RodA/SpoVE family cell cycle protein [uncultured Phascolarctobacterium sp.]
MKASFLRFWKNPVQLIYMVMAILLVVGGINVFSASYVMAQDMFGSGWYYLLRYFIFAGLGLLAMNIVRRVGYKIWLHKYLLWGAFLIVFVMLLVVDLLDVSTKGASRWLYLGPFSVQPSEFAKLVVIMLAAKYLGRMMRRGERVSLFAAGDHRLVIAAAVTYAALVYKQPDLGTAAIICGLAFGVYMIAGIPGWQVLLVLGGGSLGAVIATLTSPYRLERVKVWFDPWLDQAGAGYQMVQSLLAIGSGNLVGTHWGHGAGKFFYLPEAHTDFAFAIFCQENGFFGAMLLMLLFGLLGYAFCTITCSTRDKQGFLLAGGVTFLIVGQAVANMAMVCGILPVIGVPLIFISYGGSSMMLSMAAIGLLLSVYDEEVRRAEMDVLPPEERRDGLRVVRNERWRT